MTATTFVLPACSSDTMNMAHGGFPVTIAERGPGNVLMYRAHCQNMSSDECKQVPQDYCEALRQGVVIDSYKYKEQTKGLEWIEFRCSAGTNDLQPEYIFGTPATS